MLGAFSLFRRTAPMSAVNATAMLTCANCANSFPAPTVRRGKIQIYCGNDCQIQAANKRRSSTRAGRINGITYPHAGETPGQPSSPDPMRIPPSVDMAASDRPSTPKDRLSELMEKAHSRGGVNALRLPPLRSYGASPHGLRWQRYSHHDPLPKISRTARQVS